MTAREDLLSGLYLTGPNADKLIDAYRAEVEREVRARIMPRRDDAVDEWLRGRVAPWRVCSPEWLTAFKIRDLYRLHADNQIPLAEHVCPSCPLGGGPCEQEVRDA